MKIRIEIDTTEPCPDIASLVSSVVEEVVKNHGNNGDDVRLDAAGDGLEAVDILYGRFEESDVSRGSIEYATEDLGPRYCLTFTLETTPS